MPSTFLNRIKQFFLGRTEQPAITPEEYREFVGYGYIAKGTGNLYHVEEHHKDLPHVFKLYRGLTNKELGNL